MKFCSLLLAAGVSLPVLMAEQGFADVLQENLPAAPTDETQHGMAAAYNNGSMASSAAATPAKPGEDAMALSDANKQLSAEQQKAADQEKYKACVASVAEAQRTGKDMAEKQADTNCAKVDVATSSPVGTTAGFAELQAKKDTGQQLTVGETQQLMSLPTDDVRNLSNFGGLSDPETAAAVVQGKDARTDQLNGIVKPAADPVVQPAQASVDTTKSNDQAQDVADKNAAALNQQMPADAGLKQMTAADITKATGLKGVQAQNLATLSNMYAQGKVDGTQFNAILKKNGITMDDSTLGLATVRSGLESSLGLNTSSVTKDGRLDQGVFNHFSPGEIQRISDKYGLGYSYNDVVGDINKQAQLSLLQTYDTQQLANSKVTNAGLTYAQLGMTPAQYAYALNAVGPALTPQRAAEIWQNPVPGHHDFVFNWNNNAAPYATMANNAVTAMNNGAGTPVNVADLVGDPYHTNPAATVTQNLANNTTTTYANQQNALSSIFGNNPATATNPLAALLAQGMGNVPGMPAGATTSPYTTSTGSTGTTASSNSDRQTYSYASMSKADLKSALRSWASLCDVKAPSVAGMSKAKMQEKLTLMVKKCSF